MGESFDILSILESKFNEINQKLIKLEMQHVPNINFDEETSTVMIETVGEYKAVILFCASNKLIKEVSKRMSVDGKTEVSDIYTKIYVKEYLNILCGKTVTIFNNMFHKRIKITVPVFIDGIYKDSEEEIIKSKYLPYYNIKNSSEKKIDYKCEYGSVRVIIKYNLNVL